tara:strand:+ start:12264 stop:12482 length:219 start_codon:yes stop_codon:yes gene_type:complete
MRLTGDDIALAMELRTEGVHWRHIATGLGCSRKTISRAVRAAERDGYVPPAKPRISRCRLAHTHSQALEVMA